METLHPVFRMLDTDHSGEVEITELLPFFRKLRPKMTASEKCDRLIATIDRDQSGAVNVHEFINYFRYKLGPEKSEAMIDQSIDKLFKLARGLQLQRSGVSLYDGMIGLVMRTTCEAWLNE